jgi:hypothetical protein
MGVTIPLVVRDVQITNIEESVMTLAAFRRIFSLLLLFTFIAPLAADEPEKKEPAEVVATGWWKGSYSYPDGSGQADVEFTAVLVQRGKTIVGLIKEKNTFGMTDDPWLHATLNGTIDPETREFKLTKTYDGTSGIKHDVEYTGAFSKDGAKTEGGKWILTGLEGTFKLEKDAAIKPGKLTGLWVGTNDPPKDSDLPKVKCGMILMHKGDEIVGFAKEPRAAPDGSNPWFHADLKGTFDEKTGELKLTKTYDGTAKATSEESYAGQLTLDGVAGLIGKRIVAGEESGTFNLTRDDGPLEK